MTLDVGRDVKVYKLTLLSFSTASFFQSPSSKKRSNKQNKQDEEKWTTSSIMGLKFTGKFVFGVIYAQ